MLNFAEVAAALSAYESAVLTLVDEHGYPLSVRCVFTLDSAAQVLRLTLPEGVVILAGAVSLLCHAHDDALDNLRSLTIRGNLTCEDEGWTFYPRQLTPGLGMNGFWRDVVQNAIIGPRRSAKRYLQKNGLTRPNVPWDVLRELSGE